MTENVSKLPKCRSFEEIGYGGSNNDRIFTESFKNNPLLRMRSENATKKKLSSTDPKSQLRPERSLSGP